MEKNTGNYWPIKPEGDIYCIQCKLYNQQVWALTWEDVLIFLKKNAGFSTNIVDVNPDNAISLENGSLMIVTTKDGLKEDYFLAKFGGWLETVDSRKSELIARHLEVMRERLKDYVGEGWVDKYIQNRENRLKELETIQELKDSIKRVEKCCTNGIALASSFIWDDTPEGHKYWSAIADKLL